MGASRSKPLCTSRHLLDFERTLAASFTAFSFHQPHIGMRAMRDHAATGSVHAAGQAGRS